MALAPKPTALKDNSFWGVVKNTVTGIPEAAKNLGTGIIEANVGKAFGDERLNQSNAGIAANTVLGAPAAAKDLFFPTRGYTEEQLGKANPGFWDTVTGLQKNVAEVSSSLGKLGADATGAIPGVQNFWGAVAKTKVGDALGKTGEAIADFAVPENVEQAKAMRFGDIASSLPGGTTKAVETAAAKEAPKVFEGFADVSTKLLEKLKGRSEVSKQFIADATNASDLKQPERDLIRKALEDEGDKVDVPAFADKVKAELLPLERTSHEDFNPNLDEAGENYHEDGGGTPIYENVVLPDELRGPIANYSEHVYESPVETSAGSVHFSRVNQEPRNYFGHTRVEDLPDNGTRRVIEVQSDLFQKGRLDNEGVRADYERMDKQLANQGLEWDPEIKADWEKKMVVSDAEINKLKPYQNNAAHFRMIREEVKQAALDGKTKLQFPTGETAMKIEGLGTSENWVRPLDEGGYARIKPEELKVGQQVSQGRDPLNDNWIITDVLGDGKFKAVPRSRMDDIRDSIAHEYPNEPNVSDSDLLKESRVLEHEEQFDISGKVDTENPIYKFYEKEVGKYLKNKYDAKVVTDPQGVKWYELNLKPEHKSAPVEAFGVGAGIQSQTDDQGNVTGVSFDPMNAALGIGAISGSRRLLRPGELPKLSPKEVGSLRSLSKEVPPPVSASTGGGSGLPPKGPVSLTQNIPPDFNPDKYVKEQVAAREKARVGDKPGVAGKIKSFLADAKAKIVDSSSPIEDVLYDATKKAGIKLKPSEDIHNQIDRVLRAPTIAGQFAADNGIVDVIKNVDDADALDQYLIAKHAIGLDTEGVTTGRNLAKDEALVKALGPKYQAEAKVVADYSKKLLDYSVDTGLVSRELADSLKKKYPDYVPFNRVFADGEEALPKGTGAGPASLSRQTAVQNIKGSTREIESPLRSLMAKTNDVFKQGEKNKAAQTLAGYEKLPGNPFQLQEIKGFVDDATGKKLVTLDDKAKDTISFFDNGEKRTFKTTPEIAQAAKSLNVQQLNILGKILALPVRAARLGLTGVNLPFVASNIAKDQVSAFINADKSLATSVANPVNFTKALFSAIKHDDLYKEMIRAGGGGTSYDISRNQVVETYDRIRAGKKLGSKIAYTVTHPGELIRAAEDIVGRSEELTRLQQFRGTRESLIKEGMSKEEATIAAARAARENTVNFARRGEWGTVLNSAFLYLNAGIQGTRTLLRSLKTKPLATTAKIATAAFMPMAVITAWNLNDPKRKAAYEDIPEWEKKGNMIIIPPDPTKDDKGNWNVIKVPLSQEVASLVGMVRKPIEQANGLDSLKFKDVASSILGTVSPINPLDDGAISNVVPQAIKPTLESTMNKSLYTGAPQVPQGLDKLSPENQVKDYTSGTARKIGGALNASPIKVEEFIKGTFGGVGSQALNASDQALAATGIIPKNQIGGVSIPEGITKRFAKARGGELENKAYGALDKAAAAKGDYKTENVRPIYDKAQALIAAGDTAGAQALVNNLSDKDYDIYKAIKTSEKSKTTTGLERELLPTYTKIQELKAGGKDDEAQQLVDDMTDDEYHAYTLLKNKLQ